MDTPRVLLVEDEPNLAFTLEFNLVAEGFAVDVAPTLKEAAGQLATAAYDLLVLDVMLPDGSGFEFCRELRGRGERVPIMMLTAKGNPDDIVEGLEAGADDYVTKPFELSEVLGRLKAMLRRASWTNGEPSDQEPLGEVQFGNHAIDFATGKVRIHGKVARLTDLELALMAYFVRHPDQVISRETLLEKVWELPPTTNTRSVDNFLVRLRRLFEEDPANPELFVTVRGAGYRFCPRT